MAGEISRRRRDRAVGNGGSDRFIVFLVDFVHIGSYGLQVIGKHDGRVTAWPDPGRTSGRDDDYLCCTLSFGLAFLAVFVRIGLFLFSGLTAGNNPVFFDLKEVVQAFQGVM
ncbi:hypothetical protein JWG42_03315 [Desulfoprunum benzoelyticum]|uniref:Uncharacterized protein n=1 Tax=Desulfoprunum benzoelyticum TaxID=1506996 RepID=A0A840V3C3_9BACT|nr:hypothetical protein [Desulfoprunum benzoelyticum]MBB5349328.1 hypothetical protein [Desulfoprunum benzoelyticum]MBM9529184.1 hypothetical protein [Desulfoprunum benzoelyticum]